MAQITISNAGGNWSATGTWVGGVVPTNTDSVIASATSGNLTIDGTSGSPNLARSVDFTNYVGTLTMGSTAYLKLGGSGFSSGGYIFRAVSGMTWSPNAAAIIEFASTYVVGGTGCTLTLTTSGGIITSATILSGGSGYPASSTFNLHVIPNTNAGAGTGLVSVSTNGSGVVTTFNSVVVCSATYQNGTATTVGALYIDCGGKRPCSFTISSGEYALTTTADFVAGSTLLHTAGTFRVNGQLAGNTSGVLYSSSNSNVRTLDMTSYISTIKTPDVTGVVFDVGTSTNFTFVNTTNSITKAAITLLNTTTSPTFNGGSVNFTSVNVTMPSYTAGTLTINGGTYASPWLPQVGTIQLNKTIGMPSFYFKAPNIYVNQGCSLVYTTSPFFQLPALNGNVYFAGIPTFTNGAITMAYNAPNSFAVA